MATGKQQAMEDGDRQSAKSVLANILNAKTQECQGLRVLLTVIPWDDLSHKDEAELWYFFTRCLR